LNERLAKLGRGGPEQVSKHLNAYFGQLIDAVNNHGGDVLKVYLSILQVHKIVRYSVTLTDLCGMAMHQFAGDALICMFGDDSRREPLEILAIRAIQCALVIQTEYDKYDSNQGFTLTLHVGIGVGDMYSLYVGGVDGSWVCR
jgi:class 3 adenylate cyclase